MRAAPDPRVYIADTRVLARIVDGESSRLCSIIESTRSYQLRQQALEELKQLADNVLICLEALQQAPDADSTAEAFELQIAA